MAHVSFVASRVSHCAVRFCYVVCIGACGGGGQKGAASSSRCGGDRPPPSLSESQTLPTGPTGGANAWFEAKVTRAEPVLTDNHLFLDGVEVPIARLRTTRPEGSERPTTKPMDPSAGQ